MRDDTLSSSSCLPYADAHVWSMPDTQQRVDELIRDEEQRFAKDEAKYEGEIDERLRMRVCRKDRMRIDNNNATTSFSPTELARSKKQKKEECIPEKSCDEVEVWEKALHDAKVKFEHTLLELLNTELSVKLGAQSWRANNMLLDAEVNTLTQQLSKTSDRIHQINAERREEQLRAATKMYEDKVGVLDCMQTCRLIVDALQNEDL